MNRISLIATMTNRPILCKDGSATFDVIDAEGHEVISAFDECLDVAMEYGEPGMTVITEGYLRNGIIHVVHGHSFLVLDTSGVKLTRGN